MKRLLFTLPILLLFTVSSPAQSLRKITELLRAGDFPAFRQYIDTVKYSTSDTDVRIYRGLERDLVPGFQERVINIEESFPDADLPDINTVYRYSINLIATDKEIIYYDFCRKTYPKSTMDEFELDTLDRARNGKLLDSLSAVFQTIYQAPLDKQELFTRSYMYGFACYRGAGKPELRQQLDSLVKSKNLPALDTWLRSANAERQVYAIDGLYQLKRMGYRLTPDQVRIINTIRHKKGAIVTCRGCSPSSSDIGFIVGQIMSGKPGLLRPKT